MIFYIVLGALFAIYALDLLLMVIIAAYARAHEVGDNGLGRKYTMYLYIVWCSGTVAVQMPLTAHCFLVLWIYVCLHSKNDAL